MRLEKLKLLDLIANPMGLRRYTTKIAQKKYETFRGFRVRKTRHSKTVFDKKRYIPSSRASGGLAHVD